MQDYPWKLGIGSPEAALAELASLSEEPDDQFAAKVWQLLQAGASPASLADICLLLRQAPFSSLLVEQAHGSSSVIQRFHPRLGMDQHLRRSLLHQVRHLFTPLHAQERLERALEKKTANRQGVRRLTPRNVMYRELVAQTRAQHPEGRLSKETMQQLMFTHSRLYASLTAHELRHFHKEAERLTLDKQMHAHAEEAHASAALALERDRVRQERERSGGVTNASRWCKLAEAELSILQKVYNSDAMTLHELQRRRRSASTSVTEPASEVQRFFQQIADDLPKKVKPSPAMWVKILCEHREHFQNLCIGLDFDEGEVVYRMLYAVQNPRLVVFQKLKVLPNCLPEMHTLANSDISTVVDSHTACTFELVQGECLSHHDLPFDEDDVIVAMPDTFFDEGLKLHSFAVPVSLDSYLSHFPHKHRHSEREPVQKAPRRAAPVSTDELEEHPWLAQFQHAPGSSARSSGQRQGAASLSTTHREPHERVLDLDEDQVAAAWGEFRETREAWASDIPKREDDFKMTLRGGAWTFQHRGVAADAVMVSSATELGRRWTAAYAAPKMASFSILLYHDKATLMGLEWCAKRQYYCDLWLSHDCMQYDYTNADHEGYTSSQPWQDFMAQVQPQDPAFQRAMAIQNYKPERAGLSASSSSTATGVPAAA